MKKLSKALKRALKAGAIPPIRSKVKDYVPKRRGTTHAAPIRNIFPVKGFD